MPPPAALSRAGLYYYNQHITNILTIKKKALYRVYSQWFRKIHPLPGGDHSRILFYFPSALLWISEKSGPLAALRNHSESSQNCYQPFLVETTTRTKTETKPQSSDFTLDPPFSSSQSLFSTAMISGRLIVSVVPYRRCSALYPTASHRVVLAWCELTEMCSNCDEIYTNNHINIAMHWANERRNLFYNKPNHVALLTLK